MIRVDRRPFLYRLSRHARFRPLVALVALAVVGTVLSVAGSQSSLTPQTVADLSQFNPGNIISDQEFFFGSAMSAADIQGFLDSHNPNCVSGPDGTPCLRSFTQTTTSRPADAYCNGYMGAANESAATIIAKVAVSCNISPKVLLVTLQKEQSLVTDSAGQLYAKRYQKATGYACPDTAPCDTTYWGFENQVFMSAWQFQKYAHNPNGYAYRAGHSVNILYNPDATCGSSSVFIQNQATAGLYIYTPYQPDAAILRGGSDTCSSTGNLNFWRYFTDWFVSTQSDAVAAATPIGVVDTLTMTASGFAAHGWTFDPDAPNDPVTVEMIVDGVAVGTDQADESRTDVAAVYGVGPNHGYDVSSTLKYGTHTVCINADNLAGAGVNRQLGCQTLNFTNQPPVINFDIFDEQPDGSVRVRGWAYDPDGTPVQVHVYANGVGRAYGTTVPRPDVQAVYPVAGPTAGFDINTGPLSNSASVCAFAIDTVASGNNWLALCKGFNYQPPFGAFDSATETADGKLHVHGWAIDPSLPTTAIPVHVYVDGAGWAFTADQSRPDVGSVYGGTGTNHGFDADVPITAGTHNVCTFFINQGIQGSNVVACKTVTVNYIAPFGVVDQVTPTGGGNVTVSGWTFDRSIPSQSLTVQYYVDGRGFSSAVASNSRPDVDRVYGVGAAHGFSSTLNLTPGEHSVCTFALNVGVGGPNTLMDCRGVTVN